MSSHSSKFDRSTAKPSRILGYRGPGFGKLAMGLLGLGLLYLVASSMQGSDPVISAMPQTTHSVGNLSKVQIVSFHPADARNEADILYKYSNTGYAHRWNQYGKPIIVSDDGNNQGSDSAQCKTTTLSKILLESMALGLSFEHVDSATCSKCNWGTSCPAAPNDHISVTDREEHGHSVTTFPAHSIDCLQLLSGYGQAQYYLNTSGHLTVSGTQLKWADNSGSHPFQLVGFSDVGAISANTLINPQTFLNTLASYHINFTRVFVVDPWSNNYNATFPFAKPNQYNLSQKNQNYFDRLHNFVTYAASKGIVVQISVFDQCGFENPSDVWNANPYNAANNNDANNNFQNYTDFVTIGACDAACLHSSFISWVLSAIAGSGNVILEIINEPGTTNTLNFHSWVADRIRQPIPPVTGFNATYGPGLQISLEWTNPCVSYFTGTTICVSTTGYPTSPGGTELAELPNTPGSQDSYIHTGLTRGVTYYYAAFAHDSSYNYSSRATAYVLVPGGGLAANSGAKQ